MVMAAHCCQRLLVSSIHPFNLGLTFRATGGPLSVLISLMTLCFRINFVEPSMPPSICIYSQYNALVENRLKSNIIAAPDSARYLFNL